jgi:Protein of unknown function (DUF2793)
MQTNNYAITLMIPSQINKDVLFNEAICKIDSFCNIAILSFVPNIPEDLAIGTMHIISEGLNRNSICYNPSSAAGWKILNPIKNMIFFIISERRFFLFNGETWEGV